MGSSSCGLATGPETEWVTQVHVAPQEGRGCWACSLVHTGTNRRVISQREVWAQPREAGSRHVPEQAALAFMICFV